MNILRKAAFSALACLLFVTVISGCKKSEKIITSFDDVKNGKIGVMTGTTGETIAKARFPKASETHLPVFRYVDM